MNVGERIKHRRTELGLSVDEVASRLGKNRATVYRYENNDIENLPTTVLEPLAKILETTPAYLMGWNQENSPAMENTQKKIFSTNLNKYIAESGKNQKEIADRIGVSPQIFNTWCQGIAIPRMDKIQMLADYFCINKSDLIEKHKESSKNNEFLLDSDIRRIQRARAKMTEQEKNKMMKILEASFDDYFGDDFIDEDND